MPKSRFFTDPNERVPVYEFEPGTVVDEAGNPVIPNVVYIRPRMNVGIENRVKGKMFSLDKEGKNVELHVGDNLTALLQFNILGWDGPDFVDADTKRPIPCTPENIALMVNDPFIERVADEIARRNKSPESPDPKSPATNGSTSAGNGSLVTPANTSEPLDSTTSISSLPKSTIGLNSKLTDVTPST